MSQISRVIQNGDTVIRRFMAVIIISVTVLASCSMLLQVIARYVFEIAISGLDELTGHIAVWMYLMGAAYGSVDRSQIKAEMIHLVIKDRRKLLVVRTLSTTIGAIIAGYMAVWSYEYVQWSILKHEVTPTLQIPTVIFQFPILLGAGLMVFYFLREALDLALQAYRLPSTK